jgi:hypothetical protein
MQHRRRSALAAALLLIASLGAVACSDAASTSRSGAGMNYRGSFYNLSTLEVAPVALGGVLDRQVPFQDGHIDVRRVRGVSPSRAVAGYTHTFPGTGSPEPMAWLLLSPDPDLAADPLADPALRSLVLDPGRR